MDLPRNSSDIFCRPFVKSYEILEAVLILIPYLARHMFNRDSFWEPGKKGKGKTILTSKLDGPLVVSPARCPNWCYPAYQAAAGFAFRFDIYI